MFERLRKSWQRRYLVLDQFMSGKFVTLFAITVVSVLAIFLLLCVLAYLLSGWNAGEVFIQLTNPSIPRGRQSFVDWALLVGINLFGLFVVNGILLTILVNWISNRRERYINGMARYEVINNGDFSVIIGGHPMVARLSKRILAKSKSRYVLIQTSRCPADLRLEIYAEIKDPHEVNRIIIYAGNRTSWHELEELNLVKAQEVYIVGESSDFEGNAHDSLNMKCWQLIRSNIKEPRNLKLPCHVMFDMQSTFQIFQVSDMDIDTSETFRFIPFSLNNIWAQQALGIGKYIAKHNYIPLDGDEGITFDATDRVHLIICGMSRMGIALAIEAAQVAHYPNFNNSAVESPRTLITFIDSDAEKQMYRFTEEFRNLFNLARWRFVKAPSDMYPNGMSWKIYDTVTDIANRTNSIYPWHVPTDDENLCSPFFSGYLGDNIVDIDFEFIEGDPSLPSVRNYISVACSDSVNDGKKSKTTVAICKDDTEEGLASAMYLPNDIYTNALQVLVYQTYSDCLVSALSNGETGEGVNIYSKLRPFGMINECDYENRLDDMLSRYVAYAYQCLDNGTSFYDMYKLHGRREFNRLVNNNWLDMKRDKGKTLMAKRWSNIYSANTFVSKLKSLRLDVSDNIITDQDHVKILAMTEHNRWVVEQILHGATPPDRKYADLLPIEDPELRKYLKSHNMHPDMISNDKLGSTQYYDEEIVKIVPLALWLTTCGDD